MALVIELHVETFCTVVCNSAVVIRVEHFKNKIVLQSLPVFRR